MAYTKPTITLDSATGRLSTPIPAGNYTGVNVKRDSTGQVLSHPTGFAVASARLNVIVAGDSITYGPDFGQATKPQYAPIVAAINRIASPQALGVKQGYPGKFMQDFNANYRPAVVSAIVPGKRNILVLAFGANDLENRLRAEVRADFLDAAAWACAVAELEGVLFMPTMNRTDPSFAYEKMADGSHGDFNAARLAHNQWLLDTLTPTSAKIKIAPTASSPSMFADGYPADTTLCGDQVHPTALGSTLLGEGTLAEGLALFGSITLKARSV